MTENDAKLQQIVQFLNNPENKDLEDSINNWRGLTPANEKFYQDIYKIWERAAGSAPLEKLDVNTALEKFSEKIRNQPIVTDGVAVKLNTNIFKWVAGIAAILAIAVLAYMYTQPYALTYITKTSTTAKDSVLLADGSKIYLDVNTTVKYPEKFSGDSRPLYYLSGNAFFKIAKDVSKPFIIYMDNTAVQVLGTSFNISKSAQYVNINVKTGRVMFTANSKTKSILSAGNAASYNLLTNKLTTYSGLNQNSDAWLTGELHFVDEPMANVVKKLEQYYKVDIDLDSNLSRLGKLNASFVNNNIDQVITVLEQTYPIKIYRNEDRLIISKK
ncbi:MAG: DUF4974 domain-containing protein [Sphingobacteriaceae bacterium]|nr:MAG: DUF4974 domain-containing protein [Sphingobacteriaceae bacterium]